MAGPVFDQAGRKVVSKNDKSKAAYIPTKQQRAAIEAAGIAPQQGKPFPITVLFDSARQTVQASYYYSTRSAEADRNPEPRMGQEFISTWLEPGDEVVIGNVGRELFAYKASAAPATEVEVVAEVARKATGSTILQRAKRAKGKPAKRTVSRIEFDRDPFVVAGALQRSEGKCEMPGCAAALFLRGDDRPYLEVHHIVPLAEEGDDTLVNAAALCPHCHRELHHGKDKAAKRATLAKHIGAKSP